MGRNNFFQFKQFRIIQEKTAMKVGIDGVLLGAWANISNDKSILDVGTGTGLLALMVAQRSSAIVDAVELEPEAAEEAFINFQNSKWLSRIHLSVCAFQNLKTNKKYNHIISNPPYFDNSYGGLNDKRKKARFTDSLSLKELLSKAACLLSNKGKISLILPSDKEEQLMQLASEFELHITRLCHVKPDENKKCHRILIELSFEKRATQKQLIIIRDAISGDFSDQYRAITKAYYLNL